MRKCQALQFNVYLDSTVQRTSQNLLKKPEWFERLHKFLPTFGRTVLISPNTWIVYGNLCQVLNELSPAWVKSAKVFVRFCLYVSKPHYHIPQQSLSFRASANASLKFDKQGEVLSIWSQLLSGQKRKVSNLQPSSNIGNLHKRKAELDDYQRPIRCKIQRNLTNLITSVAAFVISIKISHLLKIFIRCARLEEESQFCY